MKLITTNLVDELKDLTLRAEHVCWVTAFVMESGVKVMLDSLKKAHKLGANIQILAGDYLFITQPKALRLLLEQLPNAEIRLFQAGVRSFHPKAYLFREQHSQHLIVGSSNLSKSALTTGVEWSLQTVDVQTFETAMEEFYKLFYAPSTIQLNELTLQKYAASYDDANRVMKLSNKWDAEESMELMFGPNNTNELIFEEQNEYQLFAPRPAQQLALNALKETIGSGYNKAMVVLATGLGKTYLAAFFARNFKRVLFVAHREEILEQAKAAFLHIHPHKTVGFYNATEKNIDAEMVFASVYTLAQTYHLTKFTPDAFDLIVIDEFHHAVATTYSRILDYFEPQFLLGITATPDRLDNKDVYALCDGNVALEIHFIDAITQNWLSSFEYYGVKDEIDYSQIRWLGNHYDENELTLLQMQQSIAENVFKNWLKYKQTRTIGFCSSVKQAKFLKDYFKVQGVNAEVLTGTNTRSDRKAIRERLIAGQLEIIFTVDLFNEGVDIPTVDTLLFVRPTESLAIFTQQIGRGLRKVEGKEKCVIIDFIGNYRNADRKLRVFYPELQETQKLALEHTHIIPNTDSIIHYDVEVIDLLNEMMRKTKQYKDLIIEAYYLLKMELGKRPTYLEMYLQCGFEDINIAREFGSYVGMLHQINELSEEEIEVFQGYETLIIEIEKTAMTKSYKMVVLKGMLERGELQWQHPITAETIVDHFMTYLHAPFRKKIDSISEDRKKVIKLIETMPMTKWSSSSKGLLTFENEVFSFNFDVDLRYNRILFGWINEICVYRLHRYFAKKAEKLN